MKSLATYLLSIACLLLLCCQGNKAWAQEKDLKGVEIKHQQNPHQDIKDEKYNAFAPGMKLLALDSFLMRQYQLQSLAQLLEQQVPVFVRSYGINSLATLNFRGSSSAQSLVLWNGVPLNNAAMGITDVSMLGVGNFDEVTIAYGGSSALSGSGNVGAALLLNTNFREKDTAHPWHTKLAAEAGSFGQRKLLLQEQYQKGKLKLSAKLFAQQANNDFPFTNSQNTAQRMPNAALRSYSAQVDMAYELSHRTQLQLSLWQQQFDRHIPPALFEPYSAKQQTDQALRIYAGVEHRLRDAAFAYSKTAFAREAMQYQDSAIALRSHNTTQQLFQEFGYKKRFRDQHQVMLFVPINISFTKPQGDSLFRYQNKIALAAAYEYNAFGGKLHAAANARIERINSKTIALAGANASYALLPNLLLRANVQRSYRAPTLNEWYYSPGGNPNLKPEYGWSQDAGYEYRLKLSRSLRFYHDASLYNRNINDWILWFGGSIWTPHNIAKVHSRGIETSNKLLYQRGKWIAECRLNTAFVLATTSQSYIPADGSIGKQIPYSPRYQVQSNLSLRHSHYSLLYSHAYLGYRFITTDESQYLAPYQSGNLYLSYSPTWRGIRYKLSAQCLNLWDANYQIVAARPMPGRHYAVGFGLEF